jgi:hypothetical protein
MAHPALLGIVQMVALFALVTLALHLPVANPLGSSPSWPSWR